MKIDAVRFGVRTNKTIRKANKSTISYDMEKAILKQSNNGSVISSYGDKLIKSANNFEQINKKERKRKLKQDADEIEEDEDYEQDEEFYVQVLPDHMNVKKIQ